MTPMSRKTERKLKAKLAALKDNPEPSAQTLIPSMRLKVRRNLPTDDAAQIIIRMVHAMPGGVVDEFLAKNKRGRDTLRNLQYDMSSGIALLTGKFTVPKIKA